MIKKIKDMLELQEALELRIGGPNWREAEHNYNLCIFMECAELVDHYGWKHWKAHTPDHDAMVMELIDIWHFALASALTFNITAKEMTHNFSEASANWLEEAAVTEHSLIDLALSTGISAVTRGSFAMVNFIGLCSMLEVDFDQLYTLYISKNVLNRFRQDNGYAEGTYTKVWAGREDNEHLYELAQEPGITSETLYEHLTLRYKLTH